jgi:hypothetical protein
MPYGGGGGELLLQEDVRITTSTCEGPGQVASTCGGHRMQQSSSLVGCSMSSGVRTEVRKETSLRSAVDDADVRLRRLTYITN